VPEVARPGVWHTESIL